MTEKDQADPLSFLGQDEISDHSAKANTDRIIGGIMQFMQATPASSWGPMIVNETVPVVHLRIPISSRWTITDTAPNGATREIEVLPPEMMDTLTEEINASGILKTAPSNLPEDGTISLFVRPAHNNEAGMKAIENLKTQLATNKIPEMELKKVRINPPSRTKAQKQSEVPKPTSGRQ